MFEWNIYSVITLIGFIRICIHSSFLMISVLIRTMVYNDAIIYDFFYAFLLGRMSETLQWRFKNGKA